MYEFLSIVFGHFKILLLAKQIPNNNYMAINRDTDFVFGLLCLETKVAAQ